MKDFLTSHSIVSEIQHSTETYVARHRSPATAGANLQTRILELKPNQLWTLVAEVTRPLQPDVDRRDVLGRVIRAIEDARDAGFDSAEMAEVRGLALVALSNGERRKLTSAMAKIYGTALVERAKTG